MRKPTNQHIDYTCPIGFLPCFMKSTPFGADKSGSLNIKKSISPFKAKRKKGGFPLRSKKRAVLTDGSLQAWMAIKTTITTKNEMVMSYFLR